MSAAAASCGLRRGHPRHQRSHQALRRTGGRRQRRHVRAARSDRRTDRSQRRRQDDHLQHDRRHLPADRGSRSVSTERHLVSDGSHGDKSSWLRPDQVTARGHRPHVPEHPPLRQHVGAGQRADRHALPAEVDAARRGAASALGQPRGARGPRQGPRAARLRRAARPGSGDGQESRLRRPAPAGDRAGPGQRAASCSSSTSQPRG